MLNGRQLYQITHTHTHTHLSVDTKLPSFPWLEHYFQTVLPIRKGVATQHISNINSQHWLLRRGCLWVINNQVIISFIDQLMWSHHWSADDAVTNVLSFKHLYISSIDLDVALLPTSPATVQEQVAILLKNESRTAHMMPLPHIMSHMHYMYPSAGHAHHIAHVATCGVCVCERVMVQIWHTRVHTHRW